MAVGGTSKRVFFALTAQLAEQWNERNEKCAFFAVRACGKRQVFFDTEFGRPPKHPQAVQLERRKRGAFFELRAVGKSGCFLALKSVARSST